MKRGDVYYVDLPYCINLHEQGGNRPCVIIQNDLGNTYSSSTIVAPMTTQHRKELPVHVDIGTEYGTHKDSIVLLEQIRCVDKRRVGNYVCHLSDEVMERIDKAIEVSLGFTYINKKEHTQREGEIMNELQVINIEGVECYEENGTAYLKLETVARGLGFTQIAASGNEVVRWERVKKYLGELGIPTSGDGCLPDFIPENIFYRLAMKAKNEVAEKFQAKVADEIIPSIRKTGQYQMPNMSKELQAILMLDQKQLETDKRVSRLENTMNIDYGQQRVLEREVATAVINALGGKDSNAYREMSKKVFSECNHDVQDFFRVNSRNNIPRLKFDEAVDYIRNWCPCNNTRIAIYQCNGGQS